MKRLCSILLSLTMAAVLVLPAGAATFPDVPESHWAYSYVEEMSRRGLVSGGDNGAFDPDGNVSTAQLSVMLTTAFCPELLAQHSGDTGSWWEPYVNTAWEAGYLTDTTAGWSYEDGVWDAAVVNAPMTRFDMAQVMYNTVLAEELPLPTDEARAAAQAAIGDFVQIPEDYESAVVAMYALSYLSGINENGDFGGQGTMTRAQSCVVLCNLLGADSGSASPDPSQPPEETAPPADSGEEQEEATSVAAYEQAVFDLVNQIRAENGLDPFVYNQTLADTARAHSQDMIDRNFVDHTNPDGADPFERMEAAGLRFSAAAENIAAGQPTPEAVVDSWMNSPGHRANILGSCQELGVGLALGGSYGYYWTQCFATLR